MFYLNFLYQLEACHQRKKELHIFNHLIGSLIRAKVICRHESDLKYLSCAPENVVKIDVAVLNIVHLQTDKLICKYEASSKQIVCSYSSK